MDRRKFTQAGALGVLGAGFSRRFEQVAGMQGSYPTLLQAVNEQATGRSEAMLVKPTSGEEGPPDAAPYLAAASTGAIRL